MTKPIIRIHDSETDEVIDREMTDVEFAEYQSNQANDALTNAQLLEHASQKAALLKRLGLTEDELKSILG